MLEGVRPRLLDLHFKSGGTDGVSLMMQTLRRAFNGAGVFSNVASHDANQELGDLPIPELNYQTVEMGSMRKMIFDGGLLSEEHGFSQEDFQLDIEDKKQPIFAKLKSYILENGITHVIVRNLFSLPLNLPSTLALYDLILDSDLEAQGVNFVLIHHDFYWEPSRSSNYETKLQYVVDLLSTCFPPIIKNPRLMQFAINSLMQALIKEKYGLEVGVLPDMDEFDEGVQAEQEKEKLSLREKLGIGEDDLMVVMPTRVVSRKAIEFAIEFTKNLQKTENRTQLEEIGGSIGVGPAKRKFNPNSKIFLVIPQGEDMKDSQEYADSLALLAQENGVKMIFAGEHVRPDAVKALENDFRVPFSSVYDETDIPIYPTVGEGFGNQLLEIVKKKLLAILFEYEVFKRDIKQYLPHYVSLGDTYSVEGKPILGKTMLKFLPEEVYEKAIEKYMYYLRHPEEMKRAVEENYKSISNQFDSRIVAQRFLQQIGVH